MVKLSEDQKVSALQAALAERYQSQRAIRDRAQAVGLWALAILIGASGWIVQSHTHFTISEKVVLIAALLLAVGVVRISYFGDLERGFQAQQRVAARIEEGLGFFKPGHFDEGETPIYPSSWAAAGTPNGNGNFFKGTYRLLYVGAALLIGVMLVFA